MSLSKDSFTPRKVLVISRKGWLRPDRTEKLFSGTLNLNKTKQKRRMIFFVMFTYVSNLFRYIVATCNLAHDEETNNDLCQSHIASVKVSFEI